MHEKRDRANQHLNRASVHLNDSSFYEEYELKNKWVRIPESITEIKAFSKAERAL
jgi:hypothetical protein